jgi:hypothetical protein
MPTANSVDTTKYVDFNYRGFQSSAAAAEQYPFLLTSIEAIKNVIKMFLMSDRGDYGRNLAKGGPLISAIGKTLNDINETNLIALIKNSLSIFTNIVVIDIRVNQDLINRAWLVTIRFSDTYNKFVDNINLSVSQAQG